MSSNAQSLDVLLQVFPPCSGTGARDRISSLCNHRFNALLLHFMVMGSNCIDHSWIDAITPGKFRPKLGMRTFGIMIHRLAKIVKQACLAGNFNIRPQISRNQCRQLGNFHRMSKLILTI